MLPAPELEGPFGGGRSSALEGCGQGKGSGLLRHGRSTPSGGDLRPNGKGSEDVAGQDGVGQRAHHMGRYAHQQDMSQGKASTGAPAEALRGRQAILWWKQKFPGVPVLLSKKDVSDAFKWVPVRTADSKFFAADLPGAAFGSEWPITILYNSLTFGWCGAPGEYMLYAWVAKQISVLGKWPLVPEQVAP